MTGDFFPPCSTTESAVLQFLFSWDSAYVPSCQTWSSSPAQARESCAFLLSVYTDFWLLVRFTPLAAAAVPPDGYHFFTSGLSVSVFA